MTLATLALAASLALVRGGEPAATIVIPDGLPVVAPERVAATQLQYWTREITGAELPITTPTAPVSRLSSRVLIGRRLAEGAFPADVKRLDGTEGLCIRRKGDDLYLFGAQGCGTIFAVYELLETNTDIIWPACMEGVDRVFTPTKDLAVSSCDTLQVPSVAVRGFGHAMSARAHYFYLRNRAFGGEGGYPFRRFGFVEEDWGCHTLTYLPWEKYKDTHPEYFCLIDGNRVKPGWGANLCFTAPGAAEAFAKEFVANRIEKRPPLGIYGIGIEDTGATCLCEGCLAPIALADGRTLTVKDDPELFKSTRFFLWLNKVTEAINRTHPDVKIAAIAYLFTLRPPPIELNRNIVISYAPSSKNMREDYLHPSNVRWHKALHDWGTRFKGLSFFEYWGDGAQYPKPVSNVIARDLKVDLAEGTRRIWSEWAVEGDAGYVSGMEFWTTCRLMWNADADVRELKATYLRRAFRGAAAEMKRFYDIVEDAWFRQPGFSYWGDSPITAMRFLMQEPKRTAEAFTALSNAVAAADHPVSRRLAEGVLDVMGKYAAEVRRTASVTRGVEIPFCAEPSSLSGSEGTAWVGALPVLAGEFTGAWPKTNACAKAVPEAHLIHDGSNIWVRLRAPLPSRQWDVFLQTAARVEEGYLSFTMLPDGTVRGAERFERRTTCDWKATVTRQDDRWEAILRIGYDPKKIAPDGTVRLLLSHIGDGELVTWKGGRPHRPAMFVKAKLVR